MISGSGVDLGSVVGLVFRLGCRSRVQLCLYLRAQGGSVCLKLTSLTITVATLTYLRVKSGGVDLEVICGGGTDNLTLVEKLLRLHLVDTELK